MNTHDLPATKALAQESLETGSGGERLMSELKHWRCQLDEDEVQWWLLDQQNSQTNTLSEPVLQELDKLVSRLAEPAGDKRPRAVVIRSAKPGGFIAGAEIDEFRTLSDPATIQARLEAGHDLLQRLEHLPVPTIALIHGYCLGGGLELALACRYRIARRDASLGFPEVKLGLHPGLGGTARLCWQIPPPQALQMMLTGKPVSARRARQLRLIDAIGEERHFASAVRQAAKGKLTRQRSNLQSRFFRYKPVRAVMAYQMRRKTRQKVSQAQYPSPFALIELWRQHGGERQTMLRAERRSFAHLLAGKTARNLVRVFFLRKALKDRDAEAKTKDIRHVHVIGAGTMGGDIAGWCAAHGLRVTLEDRAARYLGPALERAQHLFERQLKSAQARRDARDRLIPDLAGQGRRRADLVIEAVPEDAKLKSELYRELEPVMHTDAVLATNTSSLLLEQLREGLTNPQRFVGLHFFNPVARMQLVEIVTHDQLDKQVLQRVLAFTGTIDRLPVQVKSAPGFLVNRVLTPYLLEALALLDEGVDKETIDAAAEDFGMPMGPVELADYIGLDICLHVAEVLHEQLEQPLYPIPGWFKSKVEREELGKKSGKGLYDYDDKGKARKQKPGSAADPQLADRLLLPLLNTCVHCRAEGIVQDNDELDGAVIFSTGFAPFKGGPLHYARTRGVDEILETLTQLRERYGQRFTPAEGWQEIVGLKEDDG